MSNDLNNILNKRYDELTSEERLIKIGKMAQKLSEQIEQGEQEQPKLLGYVVKLMNGSNNYWMITYEIYETNDPTIKKSKLKYIQKVNWSEYHRFDDKSKRQYIYEKKYKRYMGTVENPETLPEYWNNNPIIPKTIQYDITHKSSINNNFNERR